jgi:hypothetical protein
MSHRNKNTKSSHPPRRTASMNAFVRLAAESTGYVLFAFVACTVLYEVGRFGIGAYQMLNGSGNLIVCIGCSADMTDDDLEKSRYLCRKCKSRLDRTICAWCSNKLTDADRNGAGKGKRFCSKCFVKLQSALDELQ